MFQEPGITKNLNSRGGRRGCSYFSIARHSASVARHKALPDFFYFLRTFLPVISVDYPPGIIDFSMRKKVAVNFEKRNSLHTTVRSVVRRAFQFLKCTAITICFTT
jgi:hypothetical protein